jgi:hypothetical protein
MFLRIKIIGIGAFAYPMYNSRAYRSAFDGVMGGDLRYW